jgi:predicted phosphoribosyltransferase
MRAAAKAVRRLKPKQLIGAVPVASREGFAAIASLYDE